MHIPLIEDDEVDRKAIVRALRGHETVFQVAGFSNATDGCKALEENDYQCALLDYRLPDASGLEVLGRMRELQPNMPVIIITSQGDDDNGHVGL